jgi:hypothetical protein
MRIIRERPRVTCEPIAGHKDGMLGSRSLLNSI